MARLIDLAQIKDGKKIASDISDLKSSVGALATTGRGIPPVYDIRADGVHDDLPGLQAYVNQFAERGAVVVFLPATSEKYIISDTLIIPGSIQLLGEGDGSWIHSTNKLKATVKVLRASGASVTGVKLSTVNDSRESTQQGCLTIEKSSDVRVADVTADGSSATGIFVLESTKVRIFRCTVRNTMADGIHVTDGSTIVTVDSCLCEQVGDDGIAVVSYGDQPDPCVNVRVTNCTVLEGKARGISNIGGFDVNITGNSIDTTGSTGILVHKDYTAEYDSRVPLDTIVSHNKIKNSGKLLPTQGNYNGIEVGHSICTQVVGNVVDGAGQRGIVIQQLAAGAIVSGNIVRASGAAGFLVFASDVTVVNNRAERNRNQGYSFENLKGARIIANKAYNNNQEPEPGKDNFFFTRCSFVYVKDNSSVDDQATRTIDRTYEFNNCTDVFLGDNESVIGTATAGIVFSGAENARFSRPLFSQPESPQGVTLYIPGQRIISTNEKKVYTHVGDGVWA